MKFDELRDVWRQQGESKQPQPGDEEMTLEQTVDSLRQQIAKNRSDILKRDVIESGIALVLMVVFGYAIFKLPTLMSQIGIGIIIAGLCVIVYRLRLRRHTDRSVDHSQSIESFCREEKRRLDHEISLLRTVPLWYIAPGFLGANIAFIGMAGVTTFSMLYLAGTFAFCVWVARANAHAASEQMEPLREAVESLNAELDHDS